jgi:hypothetical protein
MIFDEDGLTEKKLSTWDGTYGLFLSFHLSYPLRGSSTC